jgi:hypothetical protein
VRRCDHTAERRRNLRRRQLRHGCDPQHPTQPLDACQTSCTPPICQDPARIRVVNGIGVLDVHGRIEPVAPALASIRRTRRSSWSSPTRRTVVFRTSLEAGAIIARGRGFKYVDRSARTNGGISRLKVARADELPRDGHRVRRLTKATSEMTTHLYVGAQERTLRGHWPPDQERVEARSSQHTGCSMTPVPETTSMNRTRLVAPSSSR